MQKKSKIPKLLTVFFIIHFAADILFAIPLIFFPEIFLGFLGWQKVDPIASRLVAAALFGIGIESLIGSRATLDSFNSMLNLKIIWSSAALLGFLISFIQMRENSPSALLLFTLIFLAFNLLWIYWKIKLSKSQQRGNS